MNYENEPAGPEKGLSDHAYSMPCARSYNFNAKGCAVILSYHLLSMNE